MKDYLYFFYLFLCACVGAGAEYAGSAAYWLGISWLGKDFRDLSDWLTDKASEIASWDDSQL